MRSFHSAVEKISVVTGTLFSYLIIPNILVIVYTVVMRYFFHMPPLWGFEMAIFLYGAHILLGGGYTLYKKSHVAVDILPKLLPKKGQIIMDFISSIIILFVCVIIVYKGSQAAWQSTQILERSIHQTAFNPQIWWFRWIIPISAVFIIIQAISDLIQSGTALFRKEN